MNDMLQQLAKLVLQQQDQPSHVQLDRTYILHMNDNKASLLNTSFEIAEAWKAKKEQQGYSGSSLRVLLLSSVLRPARNGSSRSGTIRPKS